MPTVLSSISILLMPHDEDFFALQFLSDVSFFKTPPAYIY